MFEKHETKKYDMSYRSNQDFSNRMRFKNQKS